MKKTLYSLMLSDDVVREVDSLAHRLGTNRSNLVNQILAEHLELVTPERQINDIFSRIESLLGNDRSLVPFFIPNANSISLKSSLQYRYRPTVKYSVELYADRHSALGELSVVFRTQSLSLLSEMEQFFRTLKTIEDEVVAPYFSNPITYTLYNGKFTRSISLPSGNNYSTDDIANAISAYVRLFDSLMKDCLAKKSYNELKHTYLNWIKAGNTLL